MKYKKILSYFVLISIFVLSVIKVPENNCPDNSDKFVHMIMYFFVAWIFHYLKYKHYIMLSICYGILMEIIQYFLPWRSFSFLDIIANVSGTLLFGSIVRYSPILKKNGSTSKIIRKKE